jgi:hypothetical protein
LATEGCLIAGRFQRLALQAKNTGKFLNLLHMGRVMTRPYIPASFADGCPLAAESYQLPANS